MRSVERQPNDATLLVARSGTTSRRQITRTVEVLNQVNAPLVGVVLNGVSDEAAYSYGYSYRYYTRENRRPRSRQRAPEQL